MSNYKPLFYSLFAIFLGALFVTLVITPFVDTTTPNENSFLVTSGSLDFINNLFSGNLFESDFVIEPPEEPIDENGGTFWGNLALAIICTISPQVEVCSGFSGIGTLPLSFGITNLLNSLNIPELIFNILTFPLRAIFSLFPEGLISAISVYLISLTHIPEIILIPFTILITLGIFWGVVKLILA